MASAPTTTILPAAARGGPRSTPARFARWGPRGYSDDPWKSPTGDTLPDQVMLERSQYELYTRTYSDKLFKDP
jgi:hypothetical protein